MSSSPHRQSDIFKYNFFYWKAFGLWSGRKPNKYYRYYSIVYISITLLIYNILLTLNLAYTPPTIENLIREVIFYFTEIAVTSKVFMVIIMRDKILQAFSIIDGKDLGGDDEISKKIIEKDNKAFEKFLKLFSAISHTAYATQVFVPAIRHLIMKIKLDLPICKYYFLTDQLREDYFIYWFMYQSWGMYGHMIYNVTVDSFIAGILLSAITQLKVLNAKFVNLKLNYQEKLLPLDMQENIQTLKLRKCFERYELILEYCDIIQNVMDVTMFIVFGLSSLIICVVLCGLVLPSSTETYAFLVMYLFAMTLQIFIPGYLGTQLHYESRELVVAAYSSEWVPRSESFKRSIRLLVERTNKPIQMTGLKMMPLSLNTFTSIVKTAYSFFTLIRSF